MEFHHGHTFGGNPVACAAGLAAMRQIREQKLVEHARLMGSGCGRGWRDASDLPDDRRGAGAPGCSRASTSRADRETREAFRRRSSPASSWSVRAHQRGLIVRTATITSRSRHRWSSTRPTSTRCATSSKILWSRPNGSCRCQFHVSDSSPSPWRERAGVRAELTPDHARYLYVPARPHPDPLPPGRGD